MTQLKVAIVGLYGGFTALIGLGQVLDSDAVTVAGLMAFTAAAALTTYYMVETQP
jgi:uncharacterized membrane protein (DUF4010 family)